MGESAELEEVIPKGPEVELGIFAKVIRRSLTDIPEELLRMAESKLTSKVKPSLILYQLRLAFHEEVIRAQTDGRMFRVTNLIRDIVSEKVFYSYYLNSVYKMAWMIRPAVKYEDRTFAALTKATERYNDLIDMDITVIRKRKVDGEWVEFEETCAKKAAVLLSVIKNLEDRVKGTAIQRQINISANSPSSKQSSARLDMAAVERKLLELETKLGVNIENKDVCGQDDSDSDGKSDVSARVGHVDDEQGKKGLSDIVVEAE